MLIGDLLKSTIKDKGMSITGINKQTGVNKGTLHGYVNNSREISFDDLIKISGALGLTAGEKKLLFGMYFESVYGEKDMKAVRCAVEEMPRAFLPPTLDVPEKGYDTFPEDGFLPNIKKVYEAIVTATDIDSGTIYTNFSFEDVHLDEFFFRKAQQKDIELVHVVKKVQKDGEIDNIRSVIRSLRYMQIGQFPYIFEAWHKNDLGQLLPYYVATKKSAVLFNDKFGYIANGDNAKGELEEAIKKMVRSLPRLGEKPGDIYTVQKMWYNAGVASSDCYIEFCRYPCIAEFVTLEMMRAAAKEMPGIDKLVEMCYTYYKSLLSCNKVLYTTVSGLKDFAQTGNFYTIPEAFTDGFSPEARVEIFNRMKENIESGQMYILSNDNAIPDGIEISSGNNATILCGADTSKKNFMFPSEFLYFANDPYYIKLMRIMKDYLISCNYVHPKATALQIITDCIALAKPDEA